MAWLIFASKLLDWIASILSVCTELTALNIGREIHGYAVRALMDDNILAVMTWLICLWSVVVSRKGIWWKVIHSQQGMLSNQNWKKYLHMLKKLALQMKREICKSNHTINQNGCSWLKNTYHLIKHSWIHFMKKNGGKKGKIRVEIIPKIT